ncbi:MAG: hypothetical protein EBR30_13795 [Cytophagia bacterium]|nr:hypothetical protein [Cytophagia bacterium]NBW36065.1 hypothetical protein [Cytophagia bacterium]
MHYNSIAEYFSRLQNRTLIIFFSGILLFMVVFYLMMTKVIEPMMSFEQDYLILYTLVGLVFMEASMLAVVSRLLLAKTIVKASLGERMDDYVRVNLIRSMILLSGSFIFVLCVFLFNWEWLLMFYCLYLLFYLFYWPSRQRLCNDLKLKPLEREVIQGL